MAFNRRQRRYLQRTLGRQTKREPDRQAEATTESVEMEGCTCEPVTIAAPDGMVDVYHMQDCALVAHWRPDPAS